VLFSLCKWTDASESEKMGNIKAVAHQLAQEVVSHMSEGILCRTVTPYTSTLLRVVDDLSTRHEIVFESIVKRLGVDDSHDVSTCHRTITGVGDELFADGQCNWGRVVTMFAFSGWLVRSCSRNHGTVHGSSSDCSNFAAAIAASTGHYMADKLSGWIYEQEGWVSLFNNPVYFIQLQVGL